MVKGLKVAVKGLETKLTFLKRVSVSTEEDTRALVKLIMCQLLLSAATRINATSN